jgi:hypothetical protein
VRDEAVEMHRVSNVVVPLDIHGGALRGGGFRGDGEVEVVKKVAAPVSGAKTGSSGDG